MEDTKMTSSFRIREAVKDDIDVMVRMQQVMAFETEGLRLEEETLRRGITVPFECKNVARFNVAEDTENGKVIAMMMMTYEWSEWRAGWILWIQSVYVLPAWRRRGVFRKLYEHVKRIVQEDASIHGLRLYVERENANAIATYRRLGMKTEHYNMMKWMKSKY